jgi:hypothetical protein
MDIMQNAGVARYIRFIWEETGWEAWNQSAPPVHHEYDGIILPEVDLFLRYLSDEGVRALARVQAKGNDEIGAGLMVFLDPQARRELSDIGQSLDIYAYGGG